MAGRRLSLLLAATAGLVSLWTAAPAQAAPRCDDLDPAACLLPWPNDRFTVADSSTDTGRRVRLPLLGMPRNVLGKPISPGDYNRADGFSPGQLIVTRVPGLDTPEAFRRTGAVPITDVARSLDPDQPVVVLDAETGERHLIWSELDANPRSRADVTLLIRPAVNFREGHRYVVALRNLKDSGGRTLRPQPAFARYRDGRPPRSDPRRAQMERLFATLGAAGVAREELYLAWDFTVASERSLSGRMLAIRDDAFRQLGDRDLADLRVEGRSPSFTVESVTRPSPEEDPNVARRVEGTFRVPCYLAGGASCLPGQRFLLGAGGTPRRLVAGMVEANFACQIPRSAVEGAGANPARPSLYGHGLLGSADEIGQSQLRAMGNEHNFVFCATDWDGMSSEDLPNVATILADLSRFPTLADRVQQGMLNFLYLGRLMLHPAGFASHPAFRDGGEPVIDPRRLFYDGNSQGAIIGGALAAVAPDFERAVLGVAGMNYSTLLRRSVDFVGTYSVPLYAFYPNELERPLILSLIQMLWDRAETNGYAHHMTGDPLPNTPPHEVMLHVAFGDHQVANVSAEVEARTIGAHVMHKPVLDPDRHSDVDPYYGIKTMPSFPFAGSALVVWDSGTPTPPTTNTPPRAGDDPHEIPRRQPAARRQKSEFLRIGGGVMDVCDGGPCYADPDL